MQRESRTVYEDVTGNLPESLLTKRESVLAEVSDPLSHWPLAHERSFCSIGRLVIATLPVFSHINPTGL